MIDLILSFVPLGLWLLFAIYLIYKLYVGTTKVKRQDTNNKNRSKRKKPSVNKNNVKEQIPSAALLLPPSSSSSPPAAILGDPEKDINLELFSPPPRDPDSESEGEENQQHLPSPSPIPVSNDKNFMSNSTAISKQRIVRTRRVLIDKNRKYSQHQRKDDFYLPYHVVDSFVVPFDTSKYDNVLWTGSLPWSAKLLKSPIGRMLFIGHKIWIRDALAIKKELENIRLEAERLKEAAAMVAQKRAILAQQKAKKLEELKSKRKNNSKITPLSSDEDDEENDEKEESLLPKNQREYHENNNNNDHQSNIDQVDSPGKAPSPSLIVTMTKSFYELQGPYEKITGLVSSRYTTSMKLQFSSYYNFFAVVTSLICCFLQGFSLGNANEVGMCKNVILINLIIAGLTSFLVLWALPFIVPSHNFFILFVEVCVTITSALTFVLADSTIEDMTREEGAKLSQVISAQLVIMVGALVAALCLISLKIFGMFLLWHSDCVIVGADFYWRRFDKKKSNNVMALNVEEEDNQDDDDDEEMKSLARLRGNKENNDDDPHLLSSMGLSHSPSNSNDNRNRNYSSSPLPPNCKLVKTKKIIKRLLPIRKKEIIIHGEGDSDEEDEETKNDEGQEECQEKVAVVSSPVLRNDEVHIKENDGTGAAVAGKKPFVLEDSDVENHESENEIGDGEDEEEMEEEEDEEMEEEEEARKQ